MELEEPSRTKRPVENIPQNEPPWKKFKSQPNQNLTPNPKPQIGFLPLLSKTTSLQLNPEITMDLETPKRPAVTELERPVKKPRVVLFEPVDTNPIPITNFDFEKSKERFAQQMTSLSQVLDTPPFSHSSKGI